MEAITSPDWNIVGILGAARGARGDAEAPIGTEHLLAGITTTRGPAREALADVGATKIALLTVLRNRKDDDGAWSAADDAEASVASEDVLGEDGDRRTHYTGAAARALTAAMGDARRKDAAKFGADDLLRGLLEEENRAVELLAVCGITPQAVRARLDGGPGSREDALDPLLHATRDVLLGRGQYRRVSFWMRWMIKLSGVNWASLPAGWVRQETYEQARRLGDGTVGTEHVLLAILATHEVALQHPHLSGETQYAGGERLAALGIDYASAHHALTSPDLARLRPDPRPAEQYVNEPPTLNLDPTTDPGTGPLLDALLSEETRARQLVETLTSTPGD
ncbi:Clp protease N-terminal domain-containing protein [Streptomyces niveus]|uniref:Clp R domain-containing protein n=1 Tax=Streptomyces niveus TaxID=193462 RepID=A0ABZ2A8R5_STRNV|nr:Clp protease N-terminal domain-containing protein [Streptomyces niveus]